jgi:hypothetical protein
MAALACAGAVSCGGAPSTAASHRSASPACHPESSAERSSPSPVTFPQRPRSVDQGDLVRLVGSDHIVPDPPIPKPYPASDLTILRKTRSSDSRSVSMPAAT